MGGGKGGNPAVGADMDDSRLGVAERRVQEKFRLFNVLYVVLPTLVVTAGYVLSPFRTGMPGPTRALTVDARPVAMGAAKGGLTLAGAWELSGEDSRMGGWSGLAIDGGGLIAISDGGSWLRLAKPRPGAGRQALEATIGDIPRRLPGRVAKTEVDAESVVPDAAGYWVGFEHGNRLQHFSRDWLRSEKMVDLSRYRWPDNEGAEGLSREGRSLVVFPEKKGGEAAAVRWDGSYLKAEATPRFPGVTSGADSLGQRTLLLRRSFGALGFMAWIAESRTPGSAIRLPLTWRDNAEGMAIERMREGSVRLWVITDDNFRWPQRTVLVAFDAPPGWWPGGAVDRRSP